jgi:DNA-binding transcriptional regulator GbsR (MarR family)
MADLSPGEAEFVDRMGLFFEQLGGPRTMGRVYGWLMVCDPPRQSLTDLATTLGVSKASVSTVIRLLQEGGMVERLPSSGRQHHYRITPGGMTRLLQIQLPRMRAGVQAAEFGLSNLDEHRSEQRELLAEFRDFCEFTEQDFGEGFMRRWGEYRAERRASRRGK